MNAPRLMGGAVALLLSAAIGVIPAVGDDAGQVVAGDSGLGSGVSDDEVVPEVPADVGTVIRDAIDAAGPTVSRSAPGGSSEGTASSPPDQSDPATPAPADTSPPSDEGGAGEHSNPGPAGPARVTGLSFLLDLLEFGSEIGPHEVLGLLVSTLGTVIPTGDLPPDLVNQAYTILAVPGEVFEQFAEPTMQGFAALRASLAPLAEGNEGANMLIKMLSDAMIAAGTEGAPLTNPLDAQVVQVGKFLLVLQEDA